MSERTERNASFEQEEDQELKEQRHRAYWQANIRLIRNLLIVWAVVSLGCGILLVPLLNNFSFGSLPLGIWMAQQGSIIAFIVLLVVYAIGMNRLDAKYGYKENK